MTNWFSSSAAAGSASDAVIVPDVETEIITENFWKKLHHSPPRTNVPTPLVATAAAVTPPPQSIARRIVEEEENDATMMDSSPSRPTRQRVAQRQWNECVPVSKFLQGFRAQAAASLANAYKTHHPMHRSVNTGIVTTSLAEDIFFLVEVQLNVLHDFLEDSNILNTEDAEDLVENALLAIFRCIWAEQTRHRDVFLTSFELCCATANDFFRMMTRMEDLMTHLELKYPFLEWNALEGDNTKSEVVRREANDLATLFVSDAVYASQSSHLYVMKSIKQSSRVSEELFSRDWEDRYTHNEIILEMIRVFEDYNNDLQNYLCNDYLYHKVVVALVRASVCYYLNLLLQKSSNVAKHAQKKFANKFTTTEEQRRRRLPFACPARALCRMMYDIRILQDYFLKVSRDSQALTRVVANEMNSLTVVHEFLGLAVGHTSLDSLEEFIVVLHKRCSGGHVDITRHFLNDLWLLAAPQEEQDRIGVTIGMLTSELQMVSTRMMENKNGGGAGGQMIGTSGGGRGGGKRGEAKEITPRLDQMLLTYYEDKIWQEKISGCGGMLKGRGHH